nr:immunoglobulin heavy chain junction region [Mus musculus]NSM08175.1 immunoglobulin heavy chain junction region [Mus musculus]NSM08747.1 immunoglobulin heavy chain junction region [Mus musculus]
CARSITTVVGGDAMDYW